MTQPDRIEFNFSSYSARATDEPVRGYELTRFLGRVPASALCGLCQHVAKLPFECRSCGVLYCEQCVSCLYCGRCGLRLCQVTRGLRQVLNRLQLHCKHPRCAQVVSLGSLLTHEYYCPFKEVSCARRIACAKPGLAKDFLRVKLKPRAQVSWIGLQSLHCRYVCSVRCRKVLKFQSSVVNRDIYTALRAYFNLLQLVDAGEKELLPV